MENERLYENTYEDEVTAVEVVDNDNPEETKPNRGKFIIGALIAGAATAWLLPKIKARLERRSIKKLRKKGYIVYEPNTEPTSAEDVVYEEPSEVEEAE